MSSIRIAGNYILASVVSPLWRNSGHLQLVYDPMDGSPLIEAEVQSPDDAFFGQWDFQPFGQDHASNTPFFGNTVNYQIMDLDLNEGQTPENVWFLLESVHNALRVSASDLEYDVSQNSNSYVASAMYAVGLDLDRDYLSLVSPANVEQFPGAGTNVLLGARQNGVENVAINLNLTGENSGSDGADRIRTGIGTDQIRGAIGDDIIDGGDGEDTAVFDGIFAEYDILKTSTEEITVSHLRGAQTDGTDTLRNVEFARFSDRTIDLSAGQDIALLFDISGSMGDDIAGVKARSAEIVNAVYDNSFDARFSIITFNTIGDISTVLNFTDQETVAERKAAALAGIDRVNLSNGGVEPVYGAMLSALNGDAGNFRTDEGITRRIIIFTDEPPGDPDLSDDATAKAQDLNVDVEGGPTFNLQLASASVPVGVSEVVSAALDGEPLVTQVFTVFIGSSTSQRAAYEELASATNGGVFSAANASEVVDALLDIINLPTYGLVANTATVIEGDSGTQNVTFTIYRDNADDAATVSLAYSGTADSADFFGGVDEIVFAEGEISKTLTLSVNGDTEIEEDETIAVRIASVSERATFNSGSEVVVISNDDEEDETNEIVGTNGNDILIGTDGPDAFRSLGGLRDKMRGLDGSDQFIFGAETRNGIQERDKIRDYEVGVDEIVLEDGAAVDRIGFKCGKVAVFLEDDRDIILVCGDGVTKNNLTIITDDLLAA